MSQHLAMSHLARLGQPSWVGAPMVRGLHAGGAGSAAAMGMPEASQRHPAGEDRVLRVPCQDAPSLELITAGMA